MVIWGESRDLGIVPGPGAGKMTQQLGALADHGKLQSIQ